MLSYGLYDDLVRKLVHILPYNSSPLNSKVKYLSFKLKPTNCKFEDWLWLFKKLEAKIIVWYHQWLSWELG